MIDFTQPVLYDAENNGYMVTLTNGLPYEVLASDSLIAEVGAWLAKGNTAQPYIPPAAVPPDPKVAAQATLQSLTLQYVNSIMVGPTAPLQFAAQWLAAWKAAGN